MKRMLTILVVSAILMSFVPAFGLASDAETYGDWEYTVSDGSATIIGYNGFCSGELDIPSQIGGYRVTSIGDYAFEWCDGLTSVVIPDSVTSIGDYAFSECTGLTSVVIPDSVTSIGDAAFSGCRSLESITVDKNNGVYHSNGNCLIETASKTLIAGCKNSVIPDDGSVTSIGDYAFSECTGLTSVVIPGSVTSIGDYAFYCCSSLTSVVIPSSVTSIGYCAFYGCDLTSVFIPGSVTSIGFGAFSACDNLKSITVAENNSAYHSKGNRLIEIASKTLIAVGENSVIPDDGSVTSIGDYVFDSRDSLTSIVIPDSVTSIGDYAFFRCDSLTSVDIPGSVTSIGDCAFYRCTGLTSIVIPGSVISIGAGAFSWCDSLTSVVIPDSVTSIGVDAFYGCDSLTIYGKYGSAAHDYASLWGIPFVGRTLGDINEDGNVDIADSMLLFYHVAKKTTLSDDELSRCELTGDGAVDIADSMKLFYFVAKKIPSLD